MQDQSGPDHLRGVSGTDNWTPPAIPGQGASRLNLKSVELDSKAQEALESRVPAEKLLREAAGEQDMDD